MPSRAARICVHPGCNSLTYGGQSRCDKHQAEHKQSRKESKARFDEKRGTAAERGYNYDWQLYTKWFLKQPENVICKLHLPGCTLISKCVDHIDPPDGPKDPRFWDKDNHQGSCVRCNSVKGHKCIKGDYDMMEELER